MAIIGVTMAATAVVEVALHTAHAVFPWHAVPGFDFVYGAASCAAIVVVSKALGKAWLQRDEDHWESRR